MGGTRPRMGWWLGTAALGAAVLGAAALATHLLVPEDQPARVESGSTEQARTTPGRAPTSTVLIPPAATSPTDGPTEVASAPSAPTPPPDAPGSAPGAQGTTAGRPTPPPSTVALPVLLGPPPGPLVYEDGFDGTDLDGAAWRAAFGSRRHDLACRTPANVRIAEGTLRLVAERRSDACLDGTPRAFATGVIDSRDIDRRHPRHGRYEIRARVTHGQGLQPYVRLRHPEGSDTAQVDLLTLFHVQKPGTTTGQFNWDGPRKAGSGSTPLEPPELAPGWHTWTVDLSPAEGGTRLQWFLDGVRFHDATTAGNGPVDRVPGDALWHLTAGITVGGEWIGDPDGRLGCLDAVGRCFDGPVQPARFPATLEIDYIRVYGAPPTHTAP